MMELGLKVFSNFVLLFQVALATFDCPSLFNFYPDEHDCTKFYRCIWGKGHSFKCPSGTFWHHDLLTCDHIKNVECDKTPMSHTTFDAEKGEYKTEFFESPDFSVDHMEESYYDDEDEHGWEDDHESEGGHEEEEESHSASAGSSDYDWEEHGEESHHSEDYSEHHDEHEEDHEHEEEHEHHDHEDDYEDEHDHEDVHEHEYEDEHEEDGHEDDHGEEEHHSEEEHHTHEEHHSEEHGSEDDHHHDDHHESEDTHHDHHEHEPQIDHSDLHEHKEEIVDYKDEDYVTYVLPNYYPEYISVVEHESKQTPSGSKETAPKPTAFIQPQIQLVPHERPAKDTPELVSAPVVAVAQPVKPVIPPPIVVAKPENKEETEELIDFVIDKLQQLPRYGGHFYNPNLVITDGTRDVVEVGLSQKTLDQLESIIEPYRARKRARDWLLRKKWLQSKNRQGGSGYGDPSARQGAADKWATTQEKDRKKAHFEAYRRKTRALHSPWETTDMFRAGYGPNKIYHKK